MALSRKSFRFLFLALLLVVLEGFSWLGLIAIDSLMPETEIIPTTDRIYAKQMDAVEELLDSQTGKKKSALVLDPELGWRYREGFDSLRDIINRQGVRSRRNYEKVAGDGVTRIAVFGDSFSYGSEVSNPEAWSAQVEGIFPQFEVLNYSVPGFGVDQAYLRYLRDGKALEPRFVIIGFAPVDLRRAVNVYRRFLSTDELALFKPRFVLDEEGDLELLEVSYKDTSDYERLLDDPQLIEDQGKNDQWYSPSVYGNPLYDWSATVRLATNVAIKFHREVTDPDRVLVRSDSGERVFNTESAAFRIQSKIFEEFHQNVLEAGAVPVIMFLPARDDIVRAQDGKPTTYSPLVDFLATNDLNYLDSVEAFVASSSGVDVGRLFAPGGHYSKEGNEILAKFVGTRISGIRDVSSSSP